MQTLLKKYNLSDNPKLSCVEYADEAEWLKKRQSGLGGSDMGALLGISKYSSPLQVYKAKTEPAEQKDSIYIRKGKALESFIRDNYVKPYLQEYGYRVVHPEVMFVNSSCPWLIANLDGIAVPTEPKSYRDNIVIEIKWVSELGEQRWGGDDYYGVPAEYYAQVQHYMCVTGAQKAIVCALFDSTWEMHYYTIPFDMAFVMKMLDTSETFYNENLVKRVAPKPMVAIDRDELLEETLDKKIPEPSTVSAEMTAWCAEYAALKEELNAKEKLLKELLDKIVNAHRAGNMPDTPFRVKMSTYKRKAFDAEGLKAADPRTYEMFLKFNDCLRIYIGK
jgi:putative phage-type endonuclease